MARILIVDDEECIRITFREFLLKEGHKVHAASDADQAITILRNEPYDILISDIILPRLTGTELLNIVSKEFPNLLTIMVTGQPSMETAAGAVRDGAFDYLCKPISRQMLLDVVKRAVKRLEHMASQSTLAVKKGETVAQSNAVDLEMTNWQLRDEKSISNDGYVKLQRQQNMLNQLVKQRIDHLLKKDTNLDNDKAERDRLEKEMVDFEARIIHGQKMEALGRMSEGIAHDFNNIINGVLANIALAEEEAGQATNKYLANASVAARQAAELMADLQTFSQSNILEIDKVNPVNLAKDVIAKLSDTIDPRIKVNFDYDQEISDIRADSAQIHQVLMSLCQNSNDAILHVLNLVAGEPLADSSPQTYSIDITLDQIELDHLYCQRVPQASPGQYLTITVKDNGAGMSNHIRERIFEPFFSSKKKEGGKGLGLAKVYGIISKHEGWIDVDSLPGRGSRFQIYLPISNEKKKTENKKEPLFQDIHCGTETVLLVDDEPMLLDVAKVVLERQGYQVFLAENGAGCMNALDEYGSKINLLVLDQTMPEMNGNEVLAWVKNKFPELPCIMVSGSADEELVQKFYDMGAHRFIAKPYDLSDLSMTVREVLDGLPLRKVSS